MLSNLSVNSLLSHYSDIATFREVASYLKFHQCADLLSSHLIGIVYNPIPLPFLSGATVLRTEENNL